jgi:hypothetical protein
VILHLGVMALCAAAIAAVFGVLYRETTAAQTKFAGQAFAGLFGGGLVLGLLQFIFFR